jgi:predicted RNA-binding Zn ribbon-like protein
MKFVGGLPCLDFVNTVGGWSGDSVLEDKLEHYSDLVRWAARAGLIRDGEAHALARLAEAHRSEATHVLARAIALRQALHSLLSRALENRKPPAASVQLLAREFQIARKHQSFAATGDRFEWTWNHPRDSLDSILWRICQSAAGLLTSADLAHVRQCGGTDCGWMFLDTSRNHSRRWCDMQDCGNLEKVRRFRQRLARR